MRNFVDKIIIRFCIIYNLSLPKRIQKTLLSSAIQLMHCHNGMCESLNFASLYRYDIYIMDYLEFLIPKFNSYNFSKYSGCIPPALCTFEYWTDIDNKYDRIKFLNWCYNNVDSYDRRRC